MLRISSKTRTISHALSKPIKTYLEEAQDLLSRPSIIEIAILGEENYFEGTITTSVVLVAREDSSCDQLNAEKMKKNKEEHVTCVLFSSKINFITKQMV